ncbi:GH39 family glycosyl hydrolase [Acetatifactor aquisgranensis]|uniref:GH39 family glycosyl hydrolase n=1 Tax=Acetatifactor aquisgranensis TaxID=2941233 RepID=UPI002041DF5C|nr:hypothetical protein [Acetatifactor aquisgranensis]
MAKLKVDFGRKKGSIKPVHGVGQPPFYGTDFGMLHYLTEAGIPFSRLHDVDGFLGGGRYVDIPNLFRDFDADPENPESYDFAFTDLLISELVKSGTEPFFRLGVSIENDCLLRAYRIHPPKDYLKWAKICEGVIRHYTEGWADGFHYKIRYWEIWNEPDNYEDIMENQMWRGTKEEYYELYGVASRYLKERFPHFKIGGYASCGFYAAKDSGKAVKAANSSGRTEYFLEFFEGFLAYVKANRCPLDFFSWHTYDDVPATLFYAEYARRRLDEAGFPETEHICNEWNCEVNQRGTARHAAVTAAMLLGMQDSSLDSAMFYDARFGVGTYSGLFNPLTAQPFPAYYAFKGFHQLYLLGSQVAVDCDMENVYGAAALGEERGCIMVSNISGEDVPLVLEMGDYGVTGCKVTDQERTWEECPLPGVLSKDMVLCITVAPWRRA